MRFATSWTRECGPPSRLTVRSPFSGSLSLVRTSIATASSSSVAPVSAVASGADGRGSGEVEQLRVRPVGSVRGSPPLYEPPPEEATLTFRQNPDYQYSASFFDLTSGSENKKYYSSFTLTNAASVKIVASEQEHADAKLSLYVGQDEHRIVKHANGGWSGNKFQDSISFVDLQPGTYGIRLEQSGATYNYVTMKLLAIPIERQSDFATPDGGIWTALVTRTWLDLQQANTSIAAIARIASGANNTSDVSDWFRFQAIPEVTAATGPGITHDSVLQITVTSDHGAWFLLWNSDGKSIGYGLPNGRLGNGRTATGYKWASDLLAEDGDVYIEVRPSAAALTRTGNNDYRIHVTLLYEACSEIIDGQTTLVAWECD